jgi:hypothetical protein
VFISHAETNRMWSNARTSVTDRFIMGWTQGYSRSWAIFEMRRVRLSVVGNSCSVVTAMVGGILWWLCHRGLMNKRIEHRPNMTGKLKEGI